LGSGTDQVPQHSTILCHVTYQSARRRCRFDYMVTIRSRGAAAVLSMLQYAAEQLNDISVMFIETATLGDVTPYRVIT
jgi:hypothetical protein